MSLRFLILGLVCLGFLVLACCLHNRLLRWVGIGILLAIILLGSALFIWFVFLVPENGS